MPFSILRLDMRAPDFAKATKAELYAAALDMAAWADEHGFDLIVLSEHHGTDDDYLPSPLALAGVIAGRTRRIRISIAALLLPLYDPVKLAEDLAVLDVASGGRIGVVVGLGYRPDEYAMFGTSWKDRGRVLDEKLEVLLRAWKGEPFEWDGRRIRVTPRPVSEPHPPVFVGGMGRNAARRAARFGLPFQPGRHDEGAFQLYRDECAKRGVESPVVLPPGDGQMIWVSEDPEATWSEIGPHLLHDARTYASWQPEGQRSAVHSEAASIEELRAEGLYRVLTPDECVERAEAGGPFTPFPHFPLCGGTSPEVGWRSLELYAAKVLPRLGR